MAKTSKKSGKSNKGLPRAVRKENLLTGEEIDFRKKPAKEVRVVKLTRHLKVTLTTDEVAQRADEGAHCWAKIKDLEADGKSYSGRIKAQVLETTGKMETLQQEVRDHCTYRDVDCNEIYDYNDLLVKTIRLDTKAEIERRSMTRDELQLPLPKKNAPVADGTEKIRTGTKVDAETAKRLKEQATERLNDDGDLTASELRTRSRKQDALLEQIEDADGVAVDDELDEEDGDTEDETDEDGIIDA